MSLYHACFTFFAVIVSCLKCCHYHVSHVTIVSQVSGDKWINILYQVLYSLLYCRRHYYDLRAVNDFTVFVPHITVNIMLHKWDSFCCTLWSSKVSSPFHKHLGFCISGDKCKPYYARWMMHLWIFFRVALVVRHTNFMFHVRLFESMPNSVHTKINIAYTRLSLHGHHITL